MWKITKNLMEEKLPKSANFKESIILKEKFRIYDSNGVLYCKGVSNDSISLLAFGPLDEYAQPELGATRIDYLDPKTGKYEVL